MTLTEKNYSNVKSEISAAMASAEDQSTIFIGNLFLVVAFLCLGALSKSKPTAALISGLALFVIVHLLNAIVEPITIVKGIIFKIIIIGYLIKGIKAVLDADKLKRELNVD